MKDMGSEVWQTDDSTAYNSWSWVKDLRVKPTEEMVHELIDIVSKNGVLLLNVCPKSDGTISPDQQTLLREMGQWLKINGEAIYGTRPWKTFGEGPTRMERGGGFLDTIHYTSQDIRYTRSKDGKTLYAIAMGWPQDSVALRFVEVRQVGPDARVSLLGYDKPLEFSVDDRKCLRIEVPALAPEQRPGQHAYAFKISGFQIDLSQEARFSLPGAMELKAENAVLEGKKINTEKRDQRTNIGFWDDRAECVHWLLYVTKAGDYDVVGDFAAVADRCPLTLQVGDTELAFVVTGTGGWDKPKMMSIGRLHFDKAGVYHLILGATQGQPWHAVNLWNLKLAPQR